MTQPEASAPSLSAAFARHRGVVEAFDDHAGVGTVVEVDSGERWFFHCTRIADGSRRIDAGRAVTFGVSPQPNGLEAVDVTPEP